MQPPPRAPLVVASLFAMGAACARPAATTSTRSERPLAEEAASSGGQAVPPASATLAAGVAPPSGSPASHAPATSSVRPMAPRPGVEDRDSGVTALGELRVGARVRLKKRDRALEPAETGHTARLAYGPGQTGEIVRFVHRRVVASNADFDVAVVRWDAQTWYEWDIPWNRVEQGKVYSYEDLARLQRDNGKPVALGPIEQAAHPETLEWIGGTPKAALMKVPAPRPTRTRCAPPLRPVPGSYILTVREADRTQAIADELKGRVAVRRVWPALASMSVEATAEQLARISEDPRFADVQDNCT